jgi:hypothetical protein
MQQTHYSTPKAPFKLRHGLGPGSKMVGLSYVVICNLTMSSCVTLHMGHMAHKSKYLLISKYTKYSKYTMYSKYSKIMLSMLYTLSTLCILSTLRLNLLR